MLAVFLISPVLGFSAGLTAEHFNKHFNYRRLDMQNTTANLALKKRERASS